jgi:hypothetical protein
MSDSSRRPYELASDEPSAMVPVGYAEKSMASLMQLHSELMNEKERRVDLYRRLMDKEQALAEMKMYVRLLEEKLAKRADDGWRAPAQASERPKGPSRSGPVQSRPPQPPGPIRERVRFAVKPRTVSGQAGPIRTGNGAFRAPRGQESSDRPQHLARDGVDRPAADGWRTW